MVLQVLHLLLLIVIIIFLGLVYSDVNVKERFEIKTTYDRSQSRNSN